MKKYVFAFVMLATPALAQQPQNVTMNVSVTEAQQVLNALAQGAWKDVNPLMQKLIAQINPQIAPPPVAPEPPPAAQESLPSKTPPLATPVPLPKPKPPVPHPEK